MTQADILKSKLAEKKADPAKQPPAPVEKQVQTYLKKMMPSMAQVLPKHVSADRLARIALSEIRKTPALLECNIDSLMAAVMQSAKLGLEPGMLGQCYLVPFYNNKRKQKEVQFIIGYKGLIDLVRRSGHVSTITAREVHENDEFIIEFGLEDKVIHKPVLRGDRGPVIGYYAKAEMKDGGYAFEYMSREDVEQHRDKFSKAKDFGPWVDNFDEMAKKTVIRRLIKYLPISIELQSQLNEDGGVRHDVTQEEPEHPDVIDYVPSEEPETIDAQ